ncbi:8525_t:CDS:2 [Dentiscutata erythropus]|uniref:8525_t:CDS:1 n=1 Tax=Dentiscutata erythropus TaxID=1348616 RepID=A0A9N9HPA1_9GLOM|nr:8525_t:CDS:2 [Dentiscutata erythropus]
MKIKSRNVKFLYVISLILTVWIRLVPASKLIRNSNSQSCLQHSDAASTSCVKLSQSTCPVNRFIDFSKSIEWNIIPTNPSVALDLTNLSDFFIESSDNKVCLAASSNDVQVCPCDQSISQKWNFSSKNNLMSSAYVGKCLAAIGDQFTLNPCNSGGDSMSWEFYHVAPIFTLILIFKDAVNFYPNTLFMNNYTQLTMDTYTSKKLPSSMFSSPFSVEIPPGFQFIIDHGNNNTITYNFDMASIPPINDLSSTIIVKIKPGMIIYERENYFGASEYFNVGTLVSTPKSVGSIMMATNSKAVSNFSGNNLGLFEPIHSFMSVLADSSQISFGSLEISQSTCKDECTSGGFCSVNNVCVCKSGFTGSQCDQCAPGFWGPDCLACSLTCKGTTNSSQMTCDDGLFGTGKCKCATGFNGTNCNTCAPGFFGPNCTPCNCGNGVCDNQGKCTCNAGWDPSTNCTATKSGYFQSGNDAKACPIGCATCDSTGKCTKCLTGLNFATDNPTQCVPQNSVTCPAGQFPDTNNGNTCTPCNTNCATCFGSGPDSCLTCAAPKFYLEGGCVTPSTNGECISPSNQAFVANAAQGICNACPSACLGCSLKNPADLTNPNGNGGVQCSSCLPGYVLDNGNCVKTCSSGKVVNPNDNLNCIACNSACATCSGPSASECLSCSASNQFALNGTCSSTPCPSSYFTQNTSCIKCHPDCAECSGPGFNQCKKCPSTRPILSSEGQCVESCPDGNFADSSGKCQKCNSECSSCIGSRSDQCLGCADQTKILINGTCSGTCPAGSKMIVAERICYNLQTNTIVSPDSIPNSNTTSSELDVFTIILIVSGAIVFIILALILIRCIAVRRRVAKTNEFGGNLDENNVIKNMRNLQNSQNQVNVPEMAHSDSTTSFNENQSPPAYDITAGKLYWKRMHKKANSELSSRDYALWKLEGRHRSRRTDDWDGFVMEFPGGASSSNSDDEYNNGYDIERIGGYRGSKNSVRSNVSNLSRQNTLPAKRGLKWGENWV